jgi:hypothetical protein
MKKILLMLIVFAGLSISLAAQKVVTGKVTDENQAPLTGVSVMVKGTTVGTLTDIDGAFSLSVPDNARILSFSFIGMKTSEIEIGTQTTFNVTMEVDIGMLEEVVVIGYGTQRRGSITGSIASVTTEDIQELPVIDAGLPVWLPWLQETSPGKELPSVSADEDP